MTEDDLYASARRALESKTDGEVLREMAAHAAVREHRLNQLDQRMARVEAKVGEWDRLYQRGRGAFWIVSGAFALGAAALWHRERIADAFAWLASIMGSQKP